CEKDCQRPATAASHEGLCRFLIDIVQVGTLFTVYLYVDEMFIHQPGNVGVFKGFPLHHMTPVTGGIADGEENWLVLRLGASQGFVSPGIPVHGIVRMLLEIGARFVDEAVCGAGCHSPSYPSVS